MDQATRWHAGDAEIPGRCAKKINETQVTNETAVQINQLCMSDPFFISCVMQSHYKGRDLTTTAGVVDTVDYEMSDWESEMSKTWAEYIELTLQRINDHNAKTMLLHLSRNADRYWSTRELKKELRLDLSLDEIKHKLLLMFESDVIERGVSDIDFRGLQDGTLNLILRHRFEKEILEFAPDLKLEFHEQIEKLKSDKKRLQGMLNHVSGKLAEHLLANEFRSRKRFALSTFFEGVADSQRPAKLNIVRVRERALVQRDDGKRPVLSQVEGMEIDVLAESNDGRVVLVEVKKREAKTGLKAVEDFWAKVGAYAERFPDQIALPAFLSLGGFTDEASRFCWERGIGTAESIPFFAKTFEV